MRTGDKVLISPDLTHAKDWTQGEVIEVEHNPFAGIVISAKPQMGTYSLDIRTYLNLQRTMNDDFTFSLQIEANNLLYETRSCPWLKLEISQLRNHDCAIEI